MKLSTKFEHQVRRIHKLIEQPGSTVTWNDRIPDPDNPAQNRQIDITVIFENRLTLIECRIHNKPQDVKWIEELIGRRLSLRANGVIAVSASGFTEGAILKAREFGIVLRDFITLTKEEILSWGKSTTVNLVFYEFQNVTLTFKVPVDHIGPSFVNELYRLIENGTISLSDLYNTVANKIESKDLKEKIASIKADLNLKKEIIVETVLLRELVFEAELVLRFKEIPVPSVCIYGSPDDTALKRNVAVEKVELGDFEITQAGDEVTVALDLSTVESPPNCIFRMVDLEFSRTVHIKDAVLLGRPKIHLSFARLSLGVQFVA